MHDGAEIIWAHVLTLTATEPKKSRIAVLVKIVAFTRFDVVLVNDHVRVAVFAALFVKDSYGVTDLMDNRARAAGVGQNGAAPEHHDR